MKLQEIDAGGGDPLTHCRHLLSSLSDSIPSAVCFRGRWSAVADTVDRLRCALTDLFDLPGAASHPLAADLLQSLPPSLAAALALSRLCASADPPAGKLRTQSDLAAASSSLHQLTADAELLLRSGALLDPPTCTSSVRAIVTRLQIGTLDSRAAALDALAALIRNDDKNAAIAAAQGVLPPLVRLLDSPYKGKAAATVARIAAVQSCRHVLAAEGSPLLNHLARVLECDDGSAEHACVAIQALTLTRDGAMSIATRGGVLTLINICQAGTPSARAAAAAVLNNLAGIEELRPHFLDENVIPVLLSVISSSTPLAQENAVACLRNLTSGVDEDEHSQAVKYSILRSEGIDCIKNYWVAGGELNLEPAIRLVRNLRGNKYIAEIILSAGFLLLAVSALISASSTSRTEAARLIAEFAMMGNSRKELAEMECVPRLVWMLEAKAEEEQDAAVKALAALMPCAENRRLFKNEGKGILNVVLLLDPLIRGIEKKCAVAVLQSVSHSRRCRKEMVVAGADGYLTKLVDMEVEGAKRLLERLRRGKLWGVLAWETHRLRCLGEKPTAAT